MPYTACLNQWESWDIYGTEAPLRSSPQELKALAAFLPWSFHHLPWPAVFPVMTGPYTPVELRDNPGQGYSSPFRAGSPRKNDHDIESAMAADHSGNHSIRLSNERFFYLDPSPVKKVFCNLGIPWCPWMPMDIMDAHAASGCKLEEQALTKTASTGHPTRAQIHFPLFRFLADSSLFAEVLLCQS